MRELHLFAGIGGGILGGELLGHTCVCAVEIEEYPRKVLLQRQRDGILPRFPIWDDVCTFDGRPWRGRVDVVAGGFPCQDISSAGKGAGLKGARSGLWFEMARIIDEVRPAFAFVENSPMLIHRGLELVLSDLADMGYDAAWGIVSAADAGAPHLRKRIWILANAHGRRLGCTGEGQDQQSRRTEAERAGQAMANANMHDGSTDSGESDARANRRDIACRCREGVANSDGINGRPMQEKSGAKQRRVHQNSNWWTIEPDVGRVAHGVANRVDRLRALGNGQVPQCAALAWRVLMNKSSRNDNPEITE